MSRRRLLCLLPLLPLLLRNAAALEEEDVVTEHHSYSSRVQDSFYSFLFGLFLLLFVFFFLFSSERQLISYHVLLDRCQKSTIELNDIFSVNQFNEQKSVFLRGQVHLQRTRRQGQEPTQSNNKRIANERQEEVLWNILDRETGYRCATKSLAIRLRRKVEMFQWVEHEKREEKESKYTYSKEWCEYDVDSDDFKDSYHHRNPSRYPPLYSETIKHQSQAMVGAYILAERQIDKMRRYRICPIPSESLEQGPLSGFHVEQASIHTSAIDDSDSSYQQQCQCSMVSWASQKTVDFLVYNGYLRHPEVGTIRISYEALVEGDDVSLVGVQQQLFHPDVPFRPFLQSDANAMEPWVVSYLTRHCGACSGCGCCCACCVALSSCADLCAKAIVGNDVLLVEERLTTLNAMFTNERANLGWRAIAVRILGCLLLSMGFYLVFDPIATVLSFIPYVSGLLHSFFWVVALLLGFTTGGFIIAAAWVLYRPLYLAVLSTTISYFLGPFDTIAGVALLVCGVLSFLLALLHLLDDRNYSRRVDSELSSRPTGYLEVEKVHDAYPDAHPTAPPLSGKFKSMNIE